MTIEELYHWAMQRRYPRLQLDREKTITAGLYGWSDFMRFHSQEDLEQLHKRIEQWHEYESKGA